jgi:hypothetical protein
MIQSHRSRFRIHDAQALVHFQATLIRDIFEQSAKLWRINKIICSTTRKNK